MKINKFISLFVSISVSVSGFAALTSYAEDLTENAPIAQISQDLETDTDSQEDSKNIDVFSVYNAHKEYVESSSIVTTTTTEPVSTETTTTTVVTEESETAFKNGIDVSTFQGDVDWKAVKESGVEFAMIRAGYGKHSYQTDARFHENMKKADEAGVDCGAYWYSYAVTPEEAVLEAEACYEVIKDYQFEYPIAFDIEDESQKYLSTATISAIIESFCSTLEDKGYYVVIYSYASFLNSSVYDSTLEKYDVWVAHYGVSSPSYNRSNYGMWQYTSSGSVAGIEGNVDLDYAYKNYPYLMKKYNLNGF